MPPSPNRLHVVDALRGFAIVSIMLLHNIEHFDLYHFPAAFPEWLKSLDKGVWATLFFLFGGKAYAIFALLFGLTFSIQQENQVRKGRDFRARFAWRLALLFAFGLINSSLYQGDILMIYAILGFVLIPGASLGNGAALALAALLLFQPYQWYLVLHGWLNPAQTVADPESWALFGKSNEYLSKGTFGEVVAGNLTNGRHAVLLWTWETGRALQTCALFLLGMLAGRVGLFSGEGVVQRFRKILLGALPAFALLFATSLMIPRWIGAKAISAPLVSIFESWSNFAFMSVLVSGFVLLFASAAPQRFLNLLAPIGRMSLSNYLFQSFLGTTIYYGFGLGLYAYTGATYCVFIGLILVLVQGFVSHAWLKRHKQGPLETLWHKATWIGGE